ncbi:hypothetical protein KM925_28770 [Priestia megaterium]|jgi:hypothetical protein|nr:hypothetical protein [Priestia megaterium]MBU8589876.1 hypothetical protein [Priestia megaterium]
MMTDKDSTEYTEEVLDQRNDLTGQASKRPYPKKPKNVSIQQSNNKRHQ